MSGLGGIYNFGGRPIDPDILEAMGNTLSDLGPDGGQEAWLGSIGMVFRAFHTNPQSSLGTQPVVKRCRYMLAFDGRLDNREELITYLRDFLFGRASDLSDVRIVASAYEKWGLECFHRLIGDFALTLWDSIKNELILTRDPFGIRTLFYHMNYARIAWASHLLSLTLVMTMCPAF